MDTEPNEMTTEVIGVPHSDHDDDALMAALADALHSAGPDLDRARRNGEASWAWRSVDAELAALVHDSATDDSLRQDALVRSAVGELRLLTFEASQVSVEVELSADGLLGQVLPPGPADVVLQLGDGSEAALSTDASGTFSAPTAPVGRFRLRCRTGAGVVQSDWVSG